MFYTCCTTSDILIEMFDPFEIEFIHNSTILVYLNDLIERIKVVVILIFQMILIYYNNKWQYYLTIKIDTLDHNDPFSITKLYNFNFFISNIQRYNKSRCNLAYEKTCLVE